MTPQQQLVVLKLGTDLGTYLRAERASGASWRQIASDLADRTGITVSHETVRVWASPESKS